MEPRSDQFIIDNAERYKRLVAAFKPSKSDAKGDGSTTAASGEIVVSARVRPMLEEELAQGFPSGIHIRGKTNIIDLHALKQPVRGLPTITSSSYAVDRVFGPDSTSSEIYESLVKPLVPWAWSGGVSTLFAYGQTGSGKTYTVSALERFVAETLMDGSMEGERLINVSIIELAGQTAYDLLNARKQISILEDSLGTTQMAGALEHRVSDKETFLSYIEAAASLRRTAPTLKNDSSSRSHAICRIRFENPDLPAADDGLLYLIDLAGSEAARDKAVHDATRMKEAREINTSLSVLKDCIRGRALADADAYSGRAAAAKKPAYVPFRQSTLTKTLKHVFDPASARSCKTVVVACVNPCLADLGASKNTLRYAELLRAVVPKTKAAEYSPTAPATWNNEQLCDWIRRNSGTPPINPSLLAPTETGPQLLRLPLPEFLSRCLKTALVIPDQAQAFQAKFWKLHVDAASKPAPAPTTATPTSALVRLALLDSSADPEPDAGSIPFRERIRPGMVVRWTPREEYASFVVGGKERKGMAVVLCPAGAVGGRVRDFRGVVVNDGEEGKEEEGGRYLCAMVAPSLLPGSYGVSLWRQAVVAVEEMEAEVLMEWDEATRYYYMTV
ncbi:kinesin-like protein Klp59C [Staphylotrichum tortipilum]|uniref:Kinesin-like protein Klp59C n=1 Tax=Staphylotrichum tortipilum TaxID=2831512 RepID=A0AAN6RUE7_9PEZI|nr:kinesin-like protein Klp59C [Staphylotrichum longicolle]